MATILTRDYYIDHAYDGSDVFEEKMNDILSEDDVNKFHEYISQGFDSQYHYPALLDKCVYWQARKCTLHMIQGNLPHGPPLLGADHLEPKPDHPVLYRVFHFMCEPQVFHLLLNNCNAVNQVDKPLQGLFLIHWLLDLLVEIPPLSEWSPGKPLSMLIHSLSLPQLKPKLDSARILAQHTPSLNQVALGYVLNEEIIPLAALLLVAPFTKGDFETVKPYADIEGIASQATHDQSVTPAMFSAAGLLYIFENNGYKLPSQLENPHKGSAQLAEGDQSVVKRLIPQERSVQVSKGVQSFWSHGIQQIDNISFPRRQFSKFSQMTDRSDADEIPELSDPDANLCPDHYLLLLRSLLKENEGNDTFQLLQANLSRVNEELPALTSAIRTFCNDNDDALEHLKSCDARHVNLTYTCLLHVVLSSLVKYDYLSKWSLGQSVVKIILLLFLQRELRPTLECAQLVAERTNSVNEVARKLIQQGELIQLAGLLLVARKKAMEPFDSGDTIEKATSIENVVSQVLHGESVTAIVGAARLIKIFEKAGDALTEYWSIHNDEHEPVGVIVEVAKRIQHSGIQVLSTDVDLTDIYNARSHLEMLKSICERFGIWSSRLEMLKSVCEWLGIWGSHPKMLKSICKRLGIKIDDTSGLSSQINRNSPFPSVKSVKEMCQPPVPTSEGYPPTDDTPESEDDKTQILETSLRVPSSQAFDKLGTRPFSTSCGSVGRVSRGALKHSSASPFPWPCPCPSPSPMVRNLAYLAMKLKRGVRL